jgi:hypothetical protein
MPSLDHPYASWAVAFGILAGVSALAVVGTYLVDAAVTTRPHRGLVDLLFRPASETAILAVTGLPEVIAAILGIAITVVSIVVELASSRYTGRIADLFIKDPVNFLVMGFFVVTTVHCIWLALMFDPGFEPVVGARVTMILCTASILMLLPYFAYVFHFLGPDQVVERIRAATNAVMERARRGAKGAQIDEHQRFAASGIEQLADMALNAVENKDKGISMAGVEALRKLVVVYLDAKASLVPDWYAVRGAMADNPDFISMSPEVLEDLARRRTWVEMKILRQYQTIYGESLNRMRDINYLVAINTRLVGEAASQRGDREVLLLAIKFFNTYLRATLNAKDVRTAYNVLGQYRVFAEYLLKQSEHALATEVATYFKYYGQLAFGMGLPFVLETAAYDLCTLNELAFDVRSPERGRLLKVFLQVDKESETNVQEAALRGVRKAQVKLATYYLHRGDEAAAREIYEDMREERPERLASIRDELLQVQAKEFWEVIDRVQNFDYLPPDRKEMIARFFSMFGERLSSVAGGDGRAA